MIGLEKIDGFGKRQIYGLDSQVGLGSSIKGRSPFRIIIQELICGFLEVVGHRQYPGYFFAPNRFKSAVCPTRNRDVPPPRGMPQYLADVAAGREANFDCWAAVALQMRASSNWARFYLRLRWPQQLLDWPW